jgi:hypothetical protein
MSLGECGWRGAGFRVTDAAVLGLAFGEMSHLVHIRVSCYGLKSFYQSGLPRFLLKVFSRQNAHKCD